MSNELIIYSIRFSIYIDKIIVIKVEYKEKNKSMSLKWIGSNKTQQILVVGLRLSGLGRVEEEKERKKIEQEERDWLRLSVVVLFFV